MLDDGPCLVLRQIQVLYWSKLLCVSLGVLAPQVETPGSDVSGSLF